MHDFTVIFPRLTHARPSNAFKQALNLLRTVSEIVSPEVIARILDQLDEGDEQAPGVRSVHNQTLQQYTGDLLLDNFLQLCSGNGLADAARARQYAHHAVQKTERKPGSYGHVPYMLTYGSQAC